MRYALTGTEKCKVWKSKRPGQWCVAFSNNGCPINYPAYFPTWREAMDYATGDQ